MKFGEQLSSHLTPEWRKQYIRYEELKSMLYDIMLEAPPDGEAREQYVSQMDETFFPECEVSVVLKKNSKKVCITTKACTFQTQLSRNLRNFFKAICINPQNLERTYKDQFILLSKDC